MGGVHKHDLTSDVTHLLVGDADTPKYKFVARERPDVKVLLPSWVEAVRGSWLEGETIDVGATEEKYGLPTFHGLRICLTGFEDRMPPFLYPERVKILIQRLAELRSKLEDDVTKYGGQYTGNLTRDVTHLIAREPSGEKYRYAKQWGVKIVSIEWHEQSLERGMILDEASFNPLLPIAERGIGARLHRSTSNASLGKRGRESDGASQKARKLRRTASARFEADNDGLWTNIVASEAQSEATVDPWDGEVTKHARPDHRAPTHKSIDDPKLTGLKERSSKSEDHNKPPNNQPVLSKGLFHGYSFKLVGFDDKKSGILERHLRSHDAEVENDFSSLSPENSYLLVPHTSSMKDLSPISQLAQGVRMVTDLWLERCIHRKDFEPPSSSTSSTPFDKFPIPDFSGLMINSTGFQGIDLLHLSKIATLMGGSYREEFNDESSVLICNTLPNNEKLWHAQLWKVPAVKAAWFWDCVRKGEKLSFEPYLLQPVSHPASSNAPPSRQSLDGATKNLQSDLGARKRDALQDQDPRRTSFSGTSLSRSRHQRKGSSPFQRSSRTLECSFLDDAGPVLGEGNGESILEKTITSQTERVEKVPLQEISPNTSQTKDDTLLKTSTTPERPAQAPITGSMSPIKTSQKAGDNALLGSAISSLLQHHQNKKGRTRSLNASPSKPRPDPGASSANMIATAAAAAAAASTQDRPIIKRRGRRPLLGRAPSNLSSHSLSYDTSNIRNIHTRASSIDTMNTDGLGTPIIGPGGSSTNTPTGHRRFANLLDRTTSGLQGDDDDDDPDKPNLDHLQMTQLGYEDPDVAAWRERVAMKLSGAAAAGVGAATRDESVVDATKANGSAVITGTGKGRSSTGKTNTPAKQQHQQKTSAKDRESTAAASVAAAQGEGGLGIAKRTRLASAAAHGR